MPISRQFLSIQTSRKRSINLNRQWALPALPRTILLISAFRVTRNRQRSQLEGRRRWITKQRAREIGIHMHMPPCLPLEIQPRLLDRCILNKVNSRDSQALKLSSGNPNVNRMEIKTPQNQQNPAFPGFYWNMFFLQQFQYTCTVIGRSYPSYHFQYLPFLFLIKCIFSTYFDKRCLFRFPRKSQIL